jgi:hypothetical protein
MPGRVRSLKRSGVVLVAVLAGFLAFPMGALAFGTFGPVNPIPTGGVVWGVAIGDLNRDGKADILAGNDSSVTKPSGHISLLLGKGDGTFKPEIKIRDPRGPEGVVIGNFNGDTYKDFAVANYNLYGTTHTSSVEIFLGKKGGSFKDAGRINVGPGAWLIDSADFNGDHKSDLVVGHYDSTGAKAVAILLGKGNGSFRAPKYYAAPSGAIAGLGVGRMNGDKRPDVVTANYNSGTVCVLLTRSNGTLRAPKCKSPAGAGDSYNSVALGDFNRDGKLDVSLASYNGDDVLTLLGNGNGTLQKATSSPSITSRPNGIVASDFNRDHKRDVAIGNYFAPFGASVLFGNGDGMFNAPNAYPGSSRAEALAAGRLNKDKGPDLVVGTTSGLDVFLNQP